MMTYWISLKKQRKIMKRTFTIDEEIFINQFTHGIHSLEKMTSWFNAKDYLDKKEVILNLLNMVIQAHPTYDEIRHIANEQRLLSSSFAVKLLNQNKPYNKYGYELSDLPEKELNKGFVLLLLTLSSADNRRKNTECSNGCNHWWHNDLSDETILKKLKKGII